MQGRTLAADPGRELLPVPQVLAQVGVVNGVTLPQLINEVDKQGFAPCM